MANRSFPSLPIMTIASSSSSSTVAAPQPPQLFTPPQSQPSYFPTYPLTSGTFLQPSPAVPTATVPGSQSIASWSSVPPTAGARNHQQVCELPLHQHLPPQTAWLPPVSGGIQHVHGSETTCSSNNGVRYFSPAPGTMSIHQQPQQSSGLMGPGSTAHVHGGLPGGVTTLYNGSLFYDGTGFGMMSGSNSTGFAQSCNGNSSNNCYSLFSSSGGVGNTAPFSAVGGLLNLDTSTVANHVRHQVVSTGSPLSVGSDISSDGQNSISGGGADPCGRGDQSDAIRQVETIGSADKGHGVKQSYDEWPSL